MTTPLENLYKSTGSNGCHNNGWVKVHITFTQYKKVKLPIGDP